MMIEEEPIGKILEINNHLSSPTRRNKVFIIFEIIDCMTRRKNPYWYKIIRLLN